MLLCSQSEIKKKGYFVDTMTSKVLRDLGFRLNQALKSADDWYIGIMQNIQLENRQVFSFSVSRNLACHLTRCRLRDFDMIFANMTFRIEHKLYIA